jgi:hypothetical protein
VALAAINLAHESKDIENEARHRGHAFSRETFVRLDYHDMATVRIYAEQLHISKTGRDGRRHEKCPEHMIAEQPEDMTVRARNEKNLMSAV